MEHQWLSSGTTTDFQHCRNCGVFRDGRNDLTGCSLDDVIVILQARISSLEERTDPPREEAPGLSVLMGEDMA